MDPTRLDIIVWTYKVWTQVVGPEERGYCLRLLRACRIQGSIHVLCMKAILEVVFFILLGLRCVDVAIYSS